MGVERYQKAVREWPVEICINAAKEEGAWQEIIERRQKVVRKTRNSCCYAKPHRICKTAIYVQRMR